MRSIFYAIFVLFVAISISGCATNALTPVAATIPVVPSDIARSRIIGENCVTTVLYIFGRSGNATLKEIIDKNKNVKITLVDYEFQDSFFTQKYCIKVYGY